VAKEVRVPVGVIAPGGGRIAVIPRMIAAEDTVSTTVAGGPSAGTGPGGEARPIATEDEGAAVTQQSALGRGEHTTRPQEVFQPGEQRLRAGLVGGSQ